MVDVHEIEDISELCRVCLQLPESSQVLDLTLMYDEDDQLSYYDCFTICTQIDLLENLDLPHSLCKSCGLELQMAYDFHKKVEESKRFLEKINSRIQNTTTELEHLVTDELAATEELSEQLECEEIEEHLDMDDYQVVEELDEDAETIQIKNDTKSECGEEYIIETIDDEDERLEYEPNAQMSWEQAVVTVANESHIPIKKLHNFEIERSQEVWKTDETSSTSDKFQGEAKDESEVFIVAHIGESYSSELVSTDKLSSSTGRKRYSGKFSCEYCHKIFPNHSRMQLHRRQHEPNRPKFPCSHCGRIYATKQAMEVHVRTVHTKMGYACSICDKIYAIKKGLEVHMRYHTGDFPYVCDLCGKRFAQMCHLNTHNNVKHNSVRFCCEQPNCGKVFKSSASLRNHEFSHGVMPFECEYCQRGYPAKSKLKVHIRRKHGFDLSLEQLEHMRKFHVMRSKLNLVKVDERED